MLKNSANYKSMKYLNTTFPIGVGEKITFFFGSDFFSLDLQKSFNVL